MSFLSGRETAQKMCMLILSVLLISAYFLVLTVLVMFITGTLHLLDEDFFAFNKPDLFTAAIAIGVLAVSLRRFLKIFRKMQSSLRSMMHSEG